MFKIDHFIDILSNWHQVFSGHGCQRVTPLAILNRGPLLCLSRCGSDIFFAWRATSRLQGRDLGGIHTFTILHHCTVKRSSCTDGLQIPRFYASAPQTPKDPQARHTLSTFSACLDPDRPSTRQYPVRTWCAHARHHGLWGSYRCFSFGCLVHAVPTCWFRIGSSAISKLSETSPLELYSWCEL